MSKHKCKRPAGLAITLGIGAGLMAWKKLSNRRVAFNDDVIVSQTAVITGASSGLGESYAKRLANDGYDLILVARQQEKLEAIAQELQEAHGINVTIAVVDLIDEKAVCQLADQLAAMDNIAMLINNAGFGSRGDFVDVSAEAHHDMIKLHVATTAVLTRAVLPQMIVNGHGAIISISSTAAFFRGHDRVNYGATKLYLNAFSESLQIELEGTGVRVQTLCPGFMYTGFHNDFGRPSIPSFLWMTTDDTVDVSLNALNKKSVIVVPGWANQAQVFLTKIGLGGALLSMFYALSSKKK